MTSLLAPFDPRRRVSRSAYLRFCLRMVVVAVALLCGTIWLGAQGWREVAIVVFAANALAAAAVLARTAGRLRDRDRSPWWLAAYLVVYLASFAPIEDLADAYPVETLATALAVAAFFAWFFIETMLRAGTPGPNRHGPAPSDSM